MDESGWVYLVDRMKDQINTSGYKVWPREVEDALYEHDAVLEAAVVGAPDAYRGETVVAFVSLRSGRSATEAEMIAHCRELLAAYNFPGPSASWRSSPRLKPGKSNAPNYEAPFHSPKSRKLIMPRTVLPLKGKFAIVTGASRGIGLAIATRLAQDGAGVIITARGRESLDEAAAQIPGGKAIAVAGKSHDPAHQREVLETAHREFGAIDILVNNAGINPVYGPLMDIDLEAASKILDVNVLGTLGWTQALIGDERLGFRARGGSVVNISSVTGAVPSEGIGFYGISKAAVGHLTRTLAAELGPEIRVNSISPGVVKTQFARALYEGKEDDVLAAYPLKRLGEPEDIASAAAFLAGPDSSWITGQDLTVDGGLTMAGGSA